MPHFFVQGKIFSRLLNPFRKPPLSIIRCEVRLAITEAVISNETSLPPDLLALSNRSATILAPGPIVRLSLFENKHHRGTTHPLRPIHPPDQPSLIAGPLVLCPILIRSRKSRPTLLFGKIPDFIYCCFESFFIGRFFEIGIAPAGNYFWAFGALGGLWSAIFPAMKT